MSTTSRFRIVWVAIALSGDCLAGGADWTHFRGSDGTGVSADARPPVEWSDTKNVRWKAELPGPGTSSPIRFGGRIFVTCYSGYGLDLRSPGNIRDLKRHLICLNATDGKLLWDRAIAADPAEDVFNDRLSEHGYATQTPATDGDRVVGGARQTYTLHLYALPEAPQFDAGKGLVTREELLTGIKDSLLDSAELHVTYQRPGDDNRGGGGGDRKEKKPRAPLQDEKPSTPTTTPKP